MDVAGRLQLARGETMRTGESGSRRKPRTTLGSLAHPGEREAAAMRSGSRHPAVFRELPAEPPAGHALRVQGLRLEPGVHPRGGAHAGPRHRRLLHRLQLDRRRAAALLPRRHRHARARSRRDEHLERRLLVPRLPRLPGRAEASGRGGDRPDHAAERRRRRQRGARLGGARLRQLLRRAAGEARPGPRLPARGRGRQAGRLPGRRDQPPDVAEPVPRRPWRARDDDPPQPPPADDRRRRAAPSSAAAWSASSSTSGCRSPWRPRWARATAR